MSPDNIEHERINLQAELDAQRTASERNELGQFATPPALALQIVSEALRHIPARRKIRFLDPAIGSGSFFSALLKQTKPTRVESALGVEVDERFVEVGRHLWELHGLRIIEGDFTQTDPIESTNLLIANPPYVRHHHMNASQKERLKQLATERFGIEVSGLAGLYVHFMLLSHRWMEEGAIAAWLIPSEWMTVNYGSALREYLTNHVQLLRLHLFEPTDVQFGDALVSSSVVFFKKLKPSNSTNVQITQGGNLGSPHWEAELPVSALIGRPKWNAIISDLIQNREAVEHSFRVWRCGRGGGE